MNLIEWGSYLSTILAAITLITKIIQLISAIQRLICRFEVMKMELVEQQQISQRIGDQMVGIQERIDCIQTILMHISENSKEVLSNIYEESGV